MNLSNKAPDFMYLNKYPHEGSGKIRPCNTNEWKDYVSDDLAETINNKFLFYNQFFGYGN